MSARTPDVSTITEENLPDGLAWAKPSAATATDAVTVGVTTDSRGIHFAQARAQVPGTMGQHVAGDLLATVLLADFPQRVAEFRVLHNQSGRPLVWRAAMHGAVPAQAVATGLDDEGCTMFLARVCVRNQFVPAVVVPMSRVAVCVCKAGQFISPAYDVLCADRPRDMSPPAGNAQLMKSGGTAPPTGNVQLMTSEGTAPPNGRYEMLHTGTANELTWVSHVAPLKEAATMAPPLTPSLSMLRLKRLSDSTCYRAHESASRLDDVEQGGGWQHRSFPVARGLVWTAVRNGDVRWQSVHVGRVGLHSSTHFARIHLDDPDEPNNSDDAGSAYGGRKGGSYALLNGVSREGRLAFDIETPFEILENRGGVPLTWTSARNGDVPERAVHIEACNERDDEKSVMFLARVRYAGLRLPAMVAPARRGALCNWLGKRVVVSKYDVLTVAAERRADFVGGALLSGEQTGLLGVSEGEGGSPMHNMMQRWYPSACGVMPMCFVVAIVVVGYMLLCTIWT